MSLHSKQNIDSSAVYSLTLSDSDNWLQMGLAYLLIYVTPIET